MISSVPARASPPDPYAEQDAARFGKPACGWRLRLYEVVFESETPAGKRFDLIVIATILLSVAVVLADSVQTIRERHGTLLDAAEWLVTILFSLEYAVRLLAVNRPQRYATSFFGVVDLLAVLPSYLSLLFPEAQYLADVRILRLLRIFRIFKLTAYIDEYRMLGAAMAASRRKIMVFLSVVVMIVLIVGTLMYVIEGPQHGFTSIPVAVYWAISTMTTVGYGDMVPRTDIGRTLASIMMLMGWGILAVPTGIVTAEMTAQRFKMYLPDLRACTACGAQGHDADAGFCKHCGAPLTAA